jgi:hypothetical protein
MPNPHFQENTSGLLVLSAAVFPLPDPHLAESSPSAAKLPGKIIFHPISALSALISLSTQKDRSVI